MCFFPFGCISDRFDTSRKSVQIGQPGAISAIVYATKSRQNFSKPTLPIHTIDPKLMFSCVSFHLGAFGTIMLLHKLDAKHAKLVQLMQNFVQRSRVVIFHNERSWSTPLDPKLMCLVRLFSVWVHFGPFLYCTILAAKRAKLVQLMQKFVPWCLVRIFETNATDPLDPKLMFWCVSFRSGAFWTVSLLLKTWSKTRQTGVINAKVCATMSC